MKASYQILNGYFYYYFKLSLFQTDIICDRNWDGFKKLETEFVTKYGVEAWQDFFAYRLKPALDRDSARWLLVQWCSQGYTVKVVS